MGFIDDWRAQTTDTVVEAAKLTPLTANVDLKFELMVVGVLWPARQPIQDFEVEALGAVQQIIGGRAIAVLQLVQQWPADMLAAARSLAAQTPRSSQLDTELKQLIAYFGAFPVFARQLAQNAAAPKPAALQPAAPSLPPRVLIAYMHTDGVEFAAEVRQNLEAAGISVWRDLGQPANQRDWWAQVTHAIEQVEYVVMVMTPAAVQSKLVRRQWRHASQNGTCIFPVTRADDIDYSQLPRWIRQVHFFNLQLEWPKLIAALKQTCESPRVPFMADDLPDDFVDRPQISRQIISFLFDPLREEAITTTVGLYGAGGYGKTTLAQAVCHTDDIRQVFDNGILWLTLGETPGDLSRHVIDLIEVLSGERPGFSGLDAAVVRLNELLADREILLVIDDVWQAAHLKPFLQGGSHCARLITTRNINTLPADARIIEIGAMQPEQSLVLLRSQLPAAGSDAELRELAQRMGDWPLLLKLTNGTLRERVQKYKQPLAQAISFVGQALDQRGLTAFDNHSDRDRDLAVNQTITLSLDQLTPAGRARFNELAIFPEDVDIPQATLEMLWRATGGLDDFDTEELADHLHALSLLSKFDLTSRQIRLHKVMRNYLYYQQREQLAGIHQTFLDAHLVEVGRWSELPPADAYMWAYLPHHLLNANRAAELAAAVEDVRYLAAKILVKGPHYAESDLKLVQSLDPVNPTLGALRRLVSQASYLLVKAKNRADIINTLHSRMVDIPELVEQANLADLPRPVITARHILPDLPDPRLIRTLWGHTAGVMDCAVSADGSTTVSVDKDNTIIVWNTTTGEARFKVIPVASKVWSCATNADGSVVAYGTATGQVALLDTATETVISLWSAHDAGVISCAISTDAAVVVTASKDKTLIIWDAATGRQRHALVGHERTVTRCAISADGRAVVSASNDGTVKLWDALTGVLRRSFTIGAVDSGVDQLTFYSQRDISFCCAISDDGQIVAGGASTGSLSVWRAESGELLFGVMVDKRGVSGCALNRDGSRVVAATSAGGLSVRDRAGTLLMTLQDHTRIVNNCAISADGLRVVSASDDKTVKVWDGSSLSASLVKVPHKVSALTCALSAAGQLAVTALADNSLTMWDVATGAALASLRGHTRRINGCALSADGQLVLSASQDQTGIVWEARTGRQQFVLTGHSWAVNGCALSADGLLLMTASEDSTLKVWEAATGQERFTLTGHSRAVKSCAINHNGAMAASASGDGTLRLWNPHTGEQRAILKGHSALVNTCAISADGTTVVSASLDKTLKVWDTRPAAERLTLAGHDASVTGCAVSADGRLVVSVSRDKTLKVWDGRSGVCLGTLFVDEPLHDCACSANAEDIMAVSSSGVYFLRLVQ